MYTYNKKSQQGNTILWVLALIAIGVIIFFVFRSDRPSTVTEQTPGVLSGQRETSVYEGEVVCLPHRDTSGPTTLECAYGVKTDDGKYYGLDGSALPTDKQGGYQVGERTAFEGWLLTQAEMPTNFWTTYNVAGMIAVQDYWQFRDK